MAEADPNVVKQLIAQMGGQDHLTKFAPAFVAAWAEIGVGVTKNQTNPHYGNDYADLCAVLELEKPTLARHGLAMLQCPAEMEGDKISVITILVHSSGERISFKSQVPIGPKPTAQAAGSGFTYLKRYVKKGIWGLADVDDDGEAASAPPPAPKKKAAKEPTYAETAGELVNAIQAFAGTVDELEKTLRPQVEELGDAEVNKVYVTKKRELKGAKK